MNRIHKVFDAKDMFYFIQSLLSLPDKETFTITTIDTKLEIKFLGDNKRVQKDLSNWLAIRL